jgi:hypothetical protein
MVFRRPALLAFALLTTVPCAAVAAPLVADGAPQHIIGGAPVAACGWPSTVWVDVCTATLVHPRMLVLASHCIVLGGTPVNASFGETIAAPARQVPITGCVTYPGWQPTMPGDGNDDIALCELAEPVEDVPIVPMLMGCEAEALQPGTDVTLVGFGVHDGNGTMGTKYAVDVTVQNVGTDAIFVGDASASSCNGDSGGPAFVQLGDGSWRVFGVTSGAASTSPGCPQTAVYTLMHRYAEWIETTSGLDVTPCHDADGTWNPDERCTEFPLSPAQGGAQWSGGCDDGERSAPSQHVRAGVERRRQQQLGRRGLELEQQRWRRRRQLHHGQQRRRRHCRRFEHRRCGQHWHHHGTGGRIRW